ncbi:MAG: Gfo/Idh/MocA family oxidoreductase [Actinomycetia bacterium]|nr:Gfo/Idh/MocA family oxidoreductase [Actinomycetes bacterium]
MSRSRVGVAVVGFGWMGQAHSRSIARIPSLFPERTFDAELVVISDNVQERLDEAVSSFGFREGTTDWQVAVNHPDVDMVCICAPNMFHEPIAVAAAEAGKHVFCEKPVGGTPEQTVRVAAAARQAGVITGVGYNYRWAPLVQYAKQLIDDGELGEITNYRGRFFAMYGADPMGLLSWRFQLDGAGYGVSSDILSHSVDLAHMLVGPIAKVVGTGHTFITERPLPKEAGTHFDRGESDDPTGPVENEDYFGAMVIFENGARGAFESSRAMVGPESQCAFEVYGTKGSLSWNLEKLNELQLYLDGDRARGYTTVYGGDRYPYHGHFVPGDANPIAYEDLKVIEEYEYLSSVAADRQHQPGFEEAIDYVSVQQALLTSWKSESWEPVIRLGEDH